MSTIRELIASQSDNIKEVYEKLHAMPELGMEEHKTYAYLREVMEESGVFDEIIQAGDTGLIGLIDSGKEGPTIGIRADIDALEFDIDGKRTNFHGCGHDAHATMGLMSAIIGKDLIKKGRLKLVLQPGEEVLEGARAIIESGHISDIDELYGCHIRPIQEATLGQASPALWHAASQVIKVTIKGKEAHGARPHLGVNAIDAGLSVISAVNAIHLNPAINFSVKCTNFHAGSGTSNIIPASADLIFDLRAEYNEDMEELIKKVEDAIEHGAQAVGASASITSSAGVPAAEYDKDLIDNLAAAIEASSSDLIDEIHTPGGEDFHFFATEAGLNTGYFGLGADLSPGLHSIDMEFDKSAIENGIEIWLNLIANRLG